MGNPLSYLHDQLEQWRADGSYQRLRVLESASAAELRAFRRADRYSAAEIALLTDQAAFHQRRAEIWRSLSVSRQRMLP